MASGQTHSGASMGIAIGVAVGWSVANILDLQQVPVLALGSLLGIILTPDLDHDSGTIDEWYVRKIGGGLLANIWGFWTAPYALAFRHRSFWSHFPIISTALRVLYLFLPIYVVFLKDQDTDLLPLSFRAFIAQLMALPMVALLSYIHLNPSGIEYWLYPLLGGLLLSDTAHWFFDGIF